MGCTQPAHGRRSGLSAPSERPSRVVYTAVFGGYDAVAPAPCGKGCEDCDFVCFTDDAGTRAEGWRLVVVPTGGEAPALLNRRYKMLPHRHLEAYQQSLYIDGHIRLNRCPSLLFDKYLSEAPIAMPTHLDRQCAYEEAEYCIADGLVPADLTRAQMHAYAAQGFPKQFGLTENGIILRRHHEPAVKALMEAWWAEYSNKARRDQLSLPYLLWRASMRVAPIAEGPRRTSRFFTLQPHTGIAASPLKLLAWQLRAFKHRSLAHRLVHDLYAWLSYGPRGKRG